MANHLWDYCSWGSRCCLSGRNNSPSKNAREQGGNNIQLTKQKKMTKTDTQAQLDAHERECAIRYTAVQEKLNAVEKRLWRLEALIMGSTVIMVSLALTVLVNLK